MFILQYKEGKAGKWLRLIGADSLSVISYFLEHSKLHDEDEGKTDVKYRIIIND